MHALILFLFLGPLVSSSSFHGVRVIGGGGEGPAGGGGGGSETRPSDRLQFVQVRSDPIAMPVRPPVVPPAVIPPRTAPAVTAATPATGIDNGVGTAGATGSGPGSGGGIGSGVGIGRGSATGSGTGGGPGRDYPPTPREVFLPPLPAPANVRGQHLRAWFDVDERGNSTLLSFEHSRDAGYNKLLERTLRATRFRPGVRADGTPVRDTAMIEIIF